MDFTSTLYRDAYSRINGLVIVGEGLADRHFRRLAELIPADREELRRLAAMEGRHAADFVGCGRNLGVRPDIPLAHHLLEPLQKQFATADQAADLVSCLVIQCLLIECIAVAAYRLYLPVADPYARSITTTVIRDEAEHLNYGEEWLQARFPEVAATVQDCAEQALPAVLNIVRELRADLRTIGIDPVDLVAEFTVGFQAALEAIGWTAAEARMQLRCLTASAFTLGAAS
ncbi:MAG: aldehyde oxygenase (deformylating) [Prochlorococcaceae cyanobacterium]